MSLKARVITTANEVEVAADAAGRLLTASSSTATLQRAAISAALAGNNTIIAAPGAGLRIKIHVLKWVAEAPVDVRYLSNATNLSGLMTFGLQQGDGFECPAAPIICGLAEAFIINLSGAIQISGYVHYVVEA